MIFKIQQTANWEYMKQRKEQIIDHNNKRENSKRQQHVYHVGDKVLLNRGTEIKYESPYIGPLDIIARMKVRRMVDHLTTGGKVSQ
jgi:hypothetical protein